MPNAPPPPPPPEDQGSNPRAEVHLGKIHCDLAEISSLRNFFGSHLSASFAFSPLVEQAGVESILTVQQVVRV